jgi:hypothetical protein
MSAFEAALDGGHWPMFQLLRRKTQDVSMTELPQDLQLGLPEAIPEVAEASQSAWLATGTLERPTIMNQRTAEVRLLVDKPALTKMQERDLIQMRTMPVGIEEDPVTSALRTHKLYLMAIAFFATTHRAMCVWQNVSFIYALALHPQLGLLIVVQWYLHVFVVATGLSMQGAVKAAVYVPCMGIPGMCIAVVALLVDLVGVYASIRTIMQVQDALELTVEAPEHLVQDAAPGVVSNLSMRWASSGAAGSWRASSACTRSGTRSGSSHLRRPRKSS